MQCFIDSNLVPRLLCMGLGIRLELTLIGYVSNIFRLMRNIGLSYIDNIMCTLSIILFSQVSDELLGASSPLLDSLLAD